MFKSIQFILCLILFFFSGYAQESDKAFLEEQNLYQKIENIEINSNIGKVHLSALYQQAPLLIAPIFSRCSGICSPFLKNLKLQLTQYKGNKKYNVLVISFDKRDDLKDMNQLAKFNELTDNQHWIFATTDSISKLTTSIGFEALWNNQRQQFEHEALLVGINENGYIARKLIGLRDEKATINMIEQINSNFVASYPLPRKNMIFSCFNYNPENGKVSLSWLGLSIMLLPAFITILIVIWFAGKKPKPI